MLAFFLFALQHLLHLLLQAGRKTGDPARVTLQGTSVNELLGHLGCE